MKDQDNLSKLRHSAAHLLAAAVLRLYPDAKLTLGPPIDDGFYYDIDFSETISEKDLPQIEDKMKELVASWSAFERREVTPEQALKHYEDNVYKQELIHEFAKDNKQLTLYKAGDFIDLCKGGHVENPAKQLKHFKLLSVAGAYWRGNEKNKMLTRIYGTAFKNKDDLDNYLNQIQEAKKRDHRKLGQELDLFAFSDLVGKGLPMFTPKGTILREKLNDFSQELRAQKGYKKVWIPHITKKQLYETSGHWAKFGDELFLVKSQETSDEMVLKPMNCPHHTQIYAAKPRSYRELPIKYMETTTTYRDEQAGELLGLSRVRSITMDDSHVFCTKEQIREVYEELLQVVQTFYEVIGMKLELRLSFWNPENQEKYLGDPTLWKYSQDILEEIAKEQKLDYSAEQGEAAFYGPKFDFMGVDALGRKWQVATIQLDFAMPERFGLKYTDTVGQEQTPVMIHHALMGSIERFLSVYIEHTEGAFPLWLTPVQVKIIPIASRHQDYAHTIAQKLMEKNIRVEVDDRSESMQKKIRNGQKEKVFYMIVIGDKERESGQVNVRARDGSTENMDIDVFVDMVRAKIDKRAK